MSNPNLRGNPNWKEDNKVKATLSRLKKLNDKINRFNEECKKLRMSRVRFVDDKIENLRDNWGIDTTLKEIEELKKAIIIGDDFEEASVVISKEEDERNKEMLDNFFKNYKPENFHKEENNIPKSVINNPFTSSEDES